MFEYKRVIVKKKERRVSCRQINKNYHPDSRGNGGSRFLLSFEKTFIEDKRRGPLIILDPLGGLLFLRQFYHRCAALAIRAASER
jgi:hypothetical protein